MGRKPSPIDVCHFDDLSAVAHDVAGALDRAAQTNLFDRIEWFQLILDRCPPTGRPLILRARSGAKTALLFLMIEDSAAAPLSSWYTLAYRPVFSGDPDREERIRLLAAIAREAKRWCRSIRLEPLPLESASELKTAFAGWGSISTVSSQNWATRIDSDFDGWWARRPKALQSTLRRKEAAITIKIINIFHIDDWNIYQKIYADSWKPAEGAPAFLTAFARQESDAGCYRLGLAYHEGQPIAAQFWTVERETAIIHKLAHRESAKTLSPGSVLSKAMFRHAVTIDHVCRIDFGTGDDAYKADWMDDRRPLIRLECFNRSDIRGWLGYIWALASKLVRRRRSA